MKMIFSQGWSELSKGSVAVDFLGTCLYVGAAAFIWFFFGITSLKCHPIGTEESFVVLTFITENR